MPRKPAQPPRPARVTNYQRSRTSATSRATGTTSATRRRGVAQVSGVTKNRGYQPKPVEAPSGAKGTLVGARTAKLHRSGPVAARRTGKEKETDKVATRNGVGQLIGSSRTKPVVAKKKSATKRAKKKANFSGLIRVFSLLGIVGATIVMLFLIGQTVVSFFLPQLFPLQENTNYLLVNADWQDATASQLYFLHLNPELKTANLVQIDPRTQVRLLGGYDNYEIRSVYPLLELEGKDQQFMTAAYSFALNEVVDRVLLVTAEGGGEEMGKMEETLTRGDLKRMFLAQLRQVWQETGQVDGQLLAAYFFLTGGANLRLSELNNESWAAFYRQNFSKATVRDCSVVVVNSTGESGLANRIAAVLEKNGYLVTRTGNYQEPLERTTIYYNDEAATCADLVERSIKVFPFEPAVELNRELPQRHRAGVVVVAGEDLL